MSLLSIFLKIILGLAIIIYWLNWYYSGYIYDFIFVYISKDWYMEFLSL